MDKCPTDEFGYLVHPEDWTEDIALLLAAEEEIELTEDHWKILHFVRDWYAQKNVTPSSRDIKVFMKKSGESRNRLFELFPYGYVQQTCKIAGMKKPRAWSTG
ncbi:MAG: sulfite reductase subunit gamma [Rhodospirillaceae bacterium]|nr:MAG: sulfite reductase subunit gamma [Rhodospirillaceae bacterium]